MRRCLDCNALIASGSRCRTCGGNRRRAIERATGPRRSSYAVHGWARAVKQRDGGRCVVCGSPVQVEAHHIRPLKDGGADSIANGVTLCRQHHRAAHRELARRGE